MEDPDRPGDHACPHTLVTSIPDGIHKHKHTHNVNRWIEAKRTGRDLSLRGAPAERDKVVPDAPSAHDTGQFQVGGRRYPPQIARPPRDLQRAAGRSVLDRLVHAMSCARTCDFGRLRQRGSRPRSVDLLGSRLGWRTEGCVVGDAVAVSVGGDHACGLAPGRGSSSVVRLRSKSLRPRRVLGERSFERKPRAPRRDER